MQEKAIGNKSKTSIGLYILGLFLSLGLSVTTIGLQELRGYVFFVLGILMFIYCVVSIINYVRKPEILVSVINDELKIFSNSKYVTLPLSSIISIKPKNAHSRFKTYKHGNLTIITKNGEEFVIRELDNIDDVKTEILTHQFKAQGAIAQESGDVI